MSLNENYRVVDLEQDKLEELLEQCRPNYGPRALSGPPTPFLWPASAECIIIFLVWFLVTRINCLVSFKYE